MDLSSSMRYGTMLGFDIQTSTRTTNNPDTLVPTFGHYSSSSAGLTGPTTNRTSTYDNYTISPSNTTTGNSSYNLTYINGFYQNAAYASPLIRAFDSYTSTDGGNTWTAPTSGSPTLPPSSYASVPGGDVPLFKSGSTTTYAQTVKDVVGSTTRNASWELDGYSQLHRTARSPTQPQGQEQTIQVRPSTATPRGPATTARPSSSGLPIRASRCITASNATHDQAVPHRISAIPRADFRPRRRRHLARPLRHLQRHSHHGQSTNWQHWPNDGGSALSSLPHHRRSTSPGRQPQASRPRISQYQQIMRLYSLELRDRQPGHNALATGECASSAPTTTPSCSTLPGR